MPYVFNIANQRKQHTAVATNIGPARAWRAPNHPQGCLITLSAIEDLAAKLGMDPLELVLKNLSLAAPRSDTYRDELMIAADLIGWKKNWRPRGQGSGVERRGLGLAIPSRARVLESPASAGSVGRCTAAATAGRCSRH